MASDTQENGIKILQITPTYGKPCGVGNFSANLHREMLGAGIEVRTQDSFAGTDFGEIVLLQHEWSTIDTESVKAFCARSSRPVVIFGYTAEISGFDDVIFAPLEVSNLSKMILEISTKNYVGLIHLASDDAISKYQFALMVADIFKLKKELITKGSVDDINFVANRPKNTSLVNKKAKRLLNTPITSLFDWLNVIKDNVKI